MSGASSKSGGELKLDSLLSCLRKNLLHISHSREWTLVLKQSLPGYTVMWKSHDYPFAYSDNRMNKHE